MIRSTFTTSLTLGLLTLGLSSSANADRVLTDDGRIIKPNKARETADGYILDFDNGTIELKSREGIASVEIEGDMSDYVPKNEDERKKLEKGYVRHRGKWVTKPAYESLLKKESAKSKERTDLLAAHADFANPWTKETAHFFVKTNNSPELLDYYCNLLEAYYKLMNKRIGIKPTPSYSRIKMTVNIYSSHEEFLQWSKEENGADVGATTLGYFWSADNTLNFYHDYDEPPASSWVALHECTHLLTFLIDQQYESQIWINEAVADYFGSSDITIGKKGKIKIEPGKLQAGRTLTVQQAIKDGNDIKLEDLFLIERKDFKGFQYAHAWSFVYFLNQFDDGKYAKGFAKFFKDLYTLKGVEFEAIPGAGKTGTAKKVSPENIRKLLLKKIGEKDTEKLEKQWKTFISEIPIEAPAARLERGIRATYKGDFESAIPDISAAIDDGLMDPLAFFNRGRAYLFTGEPESAVTDLRKAVELAPLKPGFRHLLSQALVSGPPPVMGGKDRFKEPMMQAGLAMELDPENSRYYEWFVELEKASE